jgi:hypothetical protein
MRPGRLALSRHKEIEQEACLLHRGEAAREEDRELTHL